MPCAVESFAIGVDSEAALAIVGDKLVFTAKSNGTGQVRMIDTTGAWNATEAVTMSGAGSGDQKPALGALDATYVMLGRGTISTHLCNVGNGVCADLVGGADGMAAAAIRPLSDGTTRLLWVEKDSLMRSINPVTPPFGSLPSAFSMTLPNDGMTFDGFDGEPGRLWVAGEGDFRRAEFTTNGGSVSVVGDADWVAATNGSCDPSVPRRLYAGTTLNPARAVYSDVVAADGSQALDPVEGLFGNWNQGPIIDAAINVGDADRDYLYVSVGGQLAVFPASGLDLDTAPLFGFPAGANITIRAIEARHEEYLFFTYDDGNQGHIARWRKTRLSAPP